MIISDPQPMQKHNNIRTQEHVRMTVSVTMCIFNHEDVYSCLQLGIPKYETLPCDLNMYTIVFRDVTI